MILKVFNDATYNTPLNIDLNISNETIVLRTNETEKTVTFAELKNDELNSGFDRYVIQIIPNDDPSESADLFIKTNVINLYAETAISKMAATEYFLQAQKYGFLHIIMRAEDTSFDDCVLFVNTTTDGTFTCNKEFSYSERVITQPPKFYYPQIAVAEIERSDSSVTLEITAPTNVNKEIYLKTNVGHVPAKVPLTNGVGRFNFTPIGMATGDTATIKIGYKYYSNIISTQITK